MSVLLAHGAVDEALPVGGVALRQVHGRALVEPARHAVVRVVDGAMEHEMRQLVGG